MGIIKDKGSRDLQMIASAYYDMFSIKDWKPSPGELKLWVRRYRKREKFRREEKEKNE